MFENILSVEATLAHELKHGYDRSKGQLDKNKPEGQDFIEEEWDAVNVQNQILYNQGKSLRCDYDGKAIPNDKYKEPLKDDIPKVPESEGIKAGTTVEKTKDGAIITTTTDENGNMDIKIESSPDAKK